MAGRLPKPGGRAVLTAQPRVASVSGRAFLCSPGHRPAQVLAAAITAAQGGDVLAPVDVVVPSGLAGVTLRRAAARPRGWANVRFSSMPQLAERLCSRALALAPGLPRRPLAPPDRSLAVRQVLNLATEDSPLLRAAQRQRATAGLLASVFAELDGAPPDVANLSPTLSMRGGHVMGLYRLYRKQVAAFLTPRELLGLAAQAVASHEAPDTEVVLLAAGSFSSAEKCLLSVLHERGRLTVVLPPALSADTAGWLRVEFGMVAYATTSVPAVTTLVVAPDAEEEVRIAVRTTLAHLVRTACRPERIGIAYVTAVPYARLLAEQLTVAQVPHHVPSQRRLAQTIAGRTVGGLLSLHRRGFPRPDLLRWMADGPVLDAGGHRLPAVRWEWRSRDAGASRGLDTWRLRLTRYAEEQQSYAADRPEQSCQFDARADEALALLTEVGELYAVADAVVTSTTWPEAAERLVALLRRSLGARREVDRWSSHTSDGQPIDVRLEQDAYDAVVTLLQSLASTPGPVSPTAIADTLEEGLDAAVPSGTTVGRGVLVGSMRSVAGADFDLLLILGCTEDALPGRHRESTVLPDADRVLLSPELRTVASRRADERDRWTSALTAAETVHLSYPRADTRAQRRQSPSPWFVDQARRLDTRPHAEPITSARVDTGGLHVPWLTSYPSFEAALRRAGTFTSRHELDVALTLQGRVDELAVTDVRLARGLQAARSRGAGSFDAWSGRTGALPGPLRADVDAHLSATGLQQWATCPASHLFGVVLGVRGLEDRGGADTVDARDKGTLFHQVLETFIAGHLPTSTSPGISPDTPWTAADIAAAATLLEDRAGALTALGLTGREVLWTAQLARLRRSLVRVLAHDSALRKQRRSTPVAVEAAFGRDGDAPLVVELPTQGQVPFNGKIDRVDATEAGGLVVVDYKTGHGYGYDTIPKLTHPDAGADLVDRGRKLQLLLYGLAARQLRGLPDAEVQAWFWFVEQGDLHRGGPITAAQERRLTEVLDIVVAGVREGVYPANPGKETWQTRHATWDNCRFCPFDLVCPTTRVEQWEQSSQDPLVRPYADLVDPAEAGP